eukprot:3548259-Amphidinium_carterae.1
MDRSALPSSTAIFWREKSSCGDLPPCCPRIWRLLWLAKRPPPGLYSKNAVFVSRLPATRVWTRSHVALRELPGDKTGTGIGDSSISSSTPNSSTWSAGESMRMLFAVTPHPAPLGLQVKATTSTATRRCSRCSPPVPHHSCFVLVQVRGAAR